MAGGAGILVWAWFLGFGQIPFGLYDWRQEFFYYSVLQEALRTATVPWHVRPPFHFTDRFLASPLWVAAPHALLLRWLSVPAFVLVHVLAYATAGLAGCLRLARRYRLPPAAFFALWMLVGFNGYAASRLAVGHTVWWTGVCLLPWLWAEVLTWVESGPSGRGALRIALVIFAISLSGSFHVCTWALLFVALLGLRRSGWLAPAGLSIGTAGLLLAYRWLPGIVGFGRLAIGVPVGYQSPTDMAAALWSLRLPTSPTINAMGWWEYDMYVGPIGAAFLAVFGIWPFLADRRSPWRRLDLPLAGCMLLAYGDVYWWVFSSIPGLGAERVVSRLLVVPLQLLSVLASLRCGRWLRSRRRSAVLVWAGVLALAVPLGWHLWLWRPASLAATMPGAWQPAPPPVLVSRSDPAYRSAVWAGGLITATALGAILITLARGRRRQDQSKVARIG